MSLKEAVRIAQSNNLMGLICTSRLLELVPALVASVKEAGLVLISDYSHDVRHSVRGHSAAAGPSVLGLGEGVDGLVAGNGVLRFREAVD
jgi:CDK inhibitor PHO81